MTATINVHEAKTHLSRLLERVHAGEEIILAKAGKAYARLVPIRDEAPSRRPGRLAGHVGEAFFEPLPEEELQAWGCCHLGGNLGGNQDGNQADNRGDE